MLLHVHRRDEEATGLPKSCCSTSERGDRDVYDYCSRYLCVHWKRCRIASTWIRWTHRIKNRIWHCYPNYCDCRGYLWSFLLEICLRPSLQQSGPSQENMARVDFDRGSSLDSSLDYCRIVSLLVDSCVALLISCSIPNFNDLLGFVSALLASWFSFGVCGMFWLFMNKGKYTSSHG